MSYHSRLCRIGDDFFGGSEIHSLIIPFSKESMRVKKSIKSQPVGYMCHIGTCDPHDIRDE